MRTTVTLPDSLYTTLVSLSRDRSRSLSATITALITTALERPRSDELRMDPLTGFPLVDIGRVITSDDVAALDDE